MITAILFGGPADGTVMEIPLFALELHFPVKRKTCYVSEGVPLYVEEIYDFEMHISETECLYVYRIKAAP